MKISQTVQAILNKQINAEFWSAYMYLSMSSWCESEGLSGFSNWFKVQYHEENAHALKLLHYINERQGKVTLKPIDAVPVVWKNVLDVVEMTYKHECKVTEYINECLNVAEAEKDRATMAELQWFVNEQVEEEAQSDNLLTKLKLIGDNKGALYQLDSVLMARQMSH